MRQNALLHGETLFVVSSGNLDDVAGPFVSQWRGINFGAHSLLVEDAKFVFIDDLEKLLRSRCGIGYVQLGENKTSSF